MRRFLAVGLLASLVIAAGAWGQARSFVHVFQQAQGSMAPGATAHVLGYTTLVLHIGAAGTPKFNVHFQGSLNGTNWSQHHCQSLALTTTPTPTHINTTAILMHTALTTGMWRCNIAGLAFFRAHISAFEHTTSVTILGSVLSLPGATGWE